ncbi:MAG: GNAT family N-acetyltransferase [Clostridiales bacterium]|nr:GNAT family N-acetyltransferase [Clostridiales bacterium]
MVIKDNDIFEGERLYLKIPSLADETAVMDFRQEFIDNNSHFAGVNSLGDYDSYEEWLEYIEKNSNEETLLPNRCLDTQFLTFDKSTNRLVGMIDIRHYLNEYLAKYAGHIGDCIRPSERCKGYASEQIGIALKICKLLGIDRVLITCDDDNIPSAKSIEKNGGVFENTVQKEERVLRRYWIETKDLDTSTFRKTI